MVNRNLSGFLHRLACQLTVDIMRIQQELRIYSGNFTMSEFRDRP